MKRYALTSSDLETMRHLVAIENAVKALRKVIVTAHVEIEEKASDNRSEVMQSFLDHVTTNLYPLIYADRLWNRDGRYELRVGDGLIWNFEDVLIHQPLDKFAQEYKNFMEPKR